MPKPLTHIIAHFLLVSILVDPNLVSAFSTGMGAIAGSLGDKSSINASLFSSEAVNVPDSWTIKDLMHFGAHVKALAIGMIRHRRLLSTNPSAFGKGITRQEVKAILDAFIQSSDYVTVRFSDNTTPLISGALKGNHAYMREAVKITRDTYGSDRRTLGILMRTSFLFMDLNRDFLGAEGWRQMLFLYENENRFFGGHGDKSYLSPWGRAAFLPHALITCLVTLCAAARAANHREFELFVRNIIARLLLHEAKHAAYADAGNPDWEDNDEIEQLSRDLDDLFSGPIMKMLEIDSDLNPRSSDEEEIRYYRETNRRTTVRVQLTDPSIAVYVEESNRRAVPAVMWGVPPTGEEILDVVLSEHISGLTLRKWRRGFVTPVLMMDGSPMEDMEKIIESPAKHAFSVVILPITEKDVQRIKDLMLESSDGLTQWMSLLRGNPTLLPVALRSVEENQPAEFQRTIEFIVDAYYGPRRSQLDSIFKSLILIPGTDERWMVHYLQAILNGVQAGIDAIRVQGNLREMNKNFHDNATAIEQRLQLFIKGDDGSQKPGKKSGGWPLVMIIGFLALSIGSLVARRAEAAIVAPLSLLRQVQYQIVGSTGRPPIKPLECAA